MQKANGFNKIYYSLLFTNLIIVYVTAQNITKYTLQKTTQIPNVDKYQFIIPSPKTIEIKIPADK